MCLRAQVVEAVAERGQTVALKLTPHVDLPLNWTAVGGAEAAEMSAQPTHMMPTSARSSGSPITLPGRVSTGAALG